MLIGVGRNFLSRLTIMDNLNPGDTLNGLGLWQDQDGGYGTTALNDSAPGWTFTKNAIWNIAGFSGQYPAGNYFPANAGAVGFRDHANDDYHLTAGSAYRNAGTDGKDLGADIDAVNAATSGVEQ